MPSLKNRKTKIYICNGCGVPFLGLFHPVRKYCSKKCSTIHALLPAQAVVAKNRRSKRGNFRCIQCGKLIEKGFIKASGMKYCSRPCFFNNKRGVRRTGNFTTLRFQRREAFLRYGRKCHKCGYDEVPEILQVHHKDHNPRNGEIENLAVVCPNCHEAEHFLLKTGRFSPLPRTKKKIENTYKFKKVAAMNKLPKQSVFVM